MNNNETRRDNFAHLTIALVTFLLLSSLAQQFLEHKWWGRLLEGALLLTVTIGVWSVRSEKGMFRGGVGLIAAILLVSLGGYLLDSQGMTVMHEILVLVFFIVATWVAVKQVLFSGQIDGNAIVGAICVYLLLGMIWALLFSLVDGVQPGSFKGLADTGANSHFMDLIYFSFVSLTTMGFGDITPVLPLARFLAYMEGIVGQFYLAILVASLVGARVSSWKQP
jgi:hypothetical protein